MTGVRMAGGVRRVRFRGWGRYDADDERGVRRRLQPRVLRVHKPARGWLWRESTTRERAVAIAVLVVIGAWVVFFFVRMSVDVGPGLDLAFRVVTYSIVVLLAWVHQMFGHVHARAIINAYTAARACPACEYEYGAIRAEADGCVVCPECGAAWRAG